MESKKRTIAQRYLVFYLKLACPDLGWDSENEIRDIVGLIVEAAKEEIMEEIKEVRADIRRLENS